MRMNDEDDEDDEENGKVNVGKCGIFLSPFFFALPLLKRKMNCFKCCNRGETTYYNIQSRRCLLG